MIITKDGHVYGWGMGEYGRLGDGMLSEHTVWIPKIIPTLQNVKYIACGEEYSMFIL
jgi:alpha-tubulin suppressor-like RCC1 family protein